MKKKRSDLVGRNSGTLGWVTLGWVTLGRVTLGWFKLGWAVTEADFL